MQDGHSHEAHPAAAGTAPPVDQLLVCLEAIAAHYGRSTSAMVLTAGLPLDNGRLTLPLLPKAAQRIGIEATHGRAKRKELIPLDVPAILLCRTGQVVVLFGGNPTSGYAVFFPEDRTARRIAAADLETRYTGTCFRMKPSFAPPSESPANIFSASNASWIR